MADRRVMNKSEKKVTGEENITITDKPKEPTIEERIAILENYIVRMDPYIKNTISESTVIKSKIDALDLDLTRVAGIQARSNNYLDGKLAEIDETFKSLVIIIKQLDDQFKELMSDDDMTGLPLEQEEQPEEEPQEP